MSFEPALTAIQSPATGPTLSVVFSQLPAAVSGLTVVRINGSRRFPVRGAVRAPVSGAGGFLDPEAPFGIPSTYVAEMFDSTGSALGFTGSSTKQLDSDRSWIHNPLDPAGALAVRVLTRTGQVVAGQIPVNVYYPVGRAAGVAVTGQRRGIANVPLAVWADDAADSAALDRMFGLVSGDLTLPPFLCVRLASRFTIPLPRPLFVAVPAPTRTPLNATVHGTREAWDVSGPEVDPPTPALAQTLLSRADLDVAYATRKARDVAYGARLALDTDYTLAGYAGITIPVSIPSGTSTAFGADDYGIGAYGA